MKKVIDLLSGKEFEVDYDNKILLHYRDKSSVYSARVIEPGAEYWIDFAEDGELSIEEKLLGQHNMVNFLYAQKVNLDWTQYDPNRTIWNSIVEYVKANERKFFFKNGNFRKSIYRNRDFQEFLKSLVAE